MYRDKKEIYIFSSHVLHISMINVLLWKVYNLIYDLEENYIYGAN